jgi:hypothetical protein
MKRTTLSVALTCLGLVTLTSFANAAMGGIGFHTTDAPIGVRHWFTEKVAGDAGIGYVTDKTEQGPGEVKATTTSVELGLPISVAKLDKAHLLFRPGYEYFMTKDEATGSPDVKTTGNGFSAELEVEYWLTEKLSLSASHGVFFGSSEDDRTPKRKVTTVTTFGENFTNVGFHLYLW